MGLIEMKELSHCQRSDNMRTQADTNEALPPLVSARKSEIPTGSSSEELERTALQYSSRLHRIAFRQLGNHEDAEDAVQDALVSAFCHLSQFEGRAQMSTWLTRIVINSARMKARRRPRQAVLSIDEMSKQQGDAIWDQFPYSGRSPEEACRERELRELLHAQLRWLSSQFREALQLFYVDGLTTREAAQILGITHSALKCRVSRARPTRLQLSK
jgi:RNA polymerase sigma-70 factor (ECF subfamily)